MTVVPRAASPASTSAAPPRRSALVIAALQAEGQSAIHRTHHIQRGYADLTGDLAGLGARILQQNE